MKKNILALAILASFATPAMADNAGTYYVAGDYGTTSWTNNSLFATPGNLTIAGGYNFTSQLSAEVGYTMFGDSTLTIGANSATVKTSSFYAAAVGTFPITDQFSIFGKLGITSNKLDVSSNYGYSASASNSGMMYGVGASYSLSEQTSLRAQYISFGDYESATSPLKASIASFGMAYTF
ncbi:MAG: porin family protein [Gammaproteobacteria bacterium]|nr:porin family protein [Gammaproteobacteria bacterium]MBU1624431.1 porin family protein [Gammaproteobacteria bacterium]MBU1981159.1 porin family protein [Gammaproteobacteria bacterium]